MIPADFHIDIIGVGGIGATAALCLAKMGVKYLTLYDFDTVGEENRSTQLLKVSGVGKLKVADVSDTIGLFSDETLIRVFSRQVDESTHLDGDMVICCVDSIQGRKDVFNAAFDSPARWFLDTRMSAMEYQHYLVDFQQEKSLGNYVNNLRLLTDENVPDVPCTEKATTFCSFLSAAHVGNVVKGIVTNDFIPHRLVQNIKTGFFISIPL